jgi:hypothetical protein
MARQVKSKAKSMFIILFDTKGFFTKNSSWQAKQSILHTTVKFYGDCVKTCEDFVPKFGEKRTGFASRQRAVSHFLFNEGIFDQVQHYCRPPFLLSYFPPF